MSKHFIHIVKEFSSLEELQEELTNLGKQLFNVDVKRDWNPEKKSFSYFLLAKKMKKSSRPPQQPREINKKGNHEKFYQEKR